MPKVTETISGYQLVFEEGTTIAVSRLHIHSSDGHITGNVQITLDKKKHRDPSFSFNFSSAQTRKQLVNHLNEKYAEWQWEEIIDQLCNEIQALVLQGDVGSEIEANDDEIIPPRYLLEPFIMEGVPTMMRGDKGVHKTITTLTFIALVTLPWYENPLELVVCPNSVNVAFLDWESNEALTKYNVQRLRKGMEIPYFKFAYRRCALPLAADIEQTQNFLERNKSKLIIIDSLGAACGGDLFKPDQALAFFEALRKLNKTSFIIAQNVKNEENKKSIFGSIFFTYGARNIFELRRSKEGISEDETDIALFQTDGNYSRKASPVGFHLTFTQDSIKIERTSIDYAQFMEKINRQQQALELLKSGAKSVNEIKEALDISRANTDMLIKRLRDKKKIVRLDNGQWGLLEISPPFESLT